MTGNINLCYITPHPRQGLAWVRQTPTFHRMDTRMDRAASPADEWAEALAESEAEVAAGQTVPLEPVLADLRAAAERLEAKRRPPARHRRTAG